jgi:hypothetical protein
MISPAGIYRHSWDNPIAKRVHCVYRTRPYSESAYIYLTEHADLSTSCPRSTNTLLRPYYLVDIMDVLE